MSAIKPHSKRERSRSSIELMSLGRQSDEMTICFPCSYRALNVWRTLPASALSCDELDIVDEQHVHRVKAVAERNHFVKAQRN